MLILSVGAIVLAVAGAALVARTGSPTAAEPTAAAKQSTVVSARNTQKFRSRPDLRPVKITVTQAARRTAPGDIFIAPFTLRGSGQSGPMIVDNRGQVIWFRPSPGKTETSFHLQRYRGKPVLTWWQGRVVKGWGEGEYVIADSSYREIARVKAGRGQKADSHDFVITPKGTALFTIYKPVKRNLSSLGGPSNATVMDGVLQEVDIATGRVLFEWHSVKDVALRESYKKLPDRGAKPIWDYFHINSVDVDSDGNLLVSARNTHAVYKIDRKSGRIIWRLGGKRSSFKMGRGTRFAWQHDAIRQSNGTISLFDNSALPQVRSQSRAIVLKVDSKRKRVSLVRKYTNPRRLLARNTGNAQLLPKRNVFVGWGAEPYFSEFSRRGRLLFNARIPSKYKTARAYRAPWSGRPLTDPAVAAKRKGGVATLYASWNGATEVTRWQVLAGAAPDSLRPIGTAARKGFETAIRARTGEPYVAAQALDRARQVLGTSKAIKP